MQEKIKQLEILVSQVTSRLSAMEEENSTLKNRVRTIESQNARLREIEDEARALRDWKRATIAQLKKLHSKLEKEIKG